MLWLTESRLRPLVCLCSAGLALLAAAAAAQDDDSPFPPGAAARVENRVAFTEGPAWHPSNNVFFSDIVNNRIMRLDRNGQLHVYRSPSGRANGLMFDKQLRLVACEGGREGGNRRVTRTEIDGTITVLTDRYANRRYNSPNDLAMDSKGNIYFSDPRYGARDDIEQVDADGKAIEGVYRIDVETGMVSRVITHEVERPNGLAISRDDGHLFVADNVNDGPNLGVGGNRKLWRFDLKPDGTIDTDSRKELFDWGTDRGPDGMALGPDGRLFVAAGFNVATPPAETSEKHKAGIYVITPDGELDFFLPVHEDMITNCTIGGPSGRTLYITAGHKLWSVPLK